MKLNSIRTGLLLLSVLCFILPFVRVSCNGKPFKEVMGVELATGQSIHSLDFLRGTPDSLENMMNTMTLTGSTEAKTEKKENDDIDIRWEVLTALIAALLALVAGIVFRQRIGRVMSAGLASIGFLALVILYFNLPTMSSEKDSFMGIEVKYDMLYGYWLTIILLALGAAVGYMEFFRTKPPGDELHVLGMDGDLGMSPDSSTPPEETPENTPTPE